VCACAVAVGGDCSVYGVHDSGCGGGRRGVV
nr:hypothetical protein [Tanacetum cinerariifolium]